MGPDKRRLAIELFDRLKQKYAPQGLSHFGQGKWYPGEPLPRWSLNCFWRRDGEPHLARTRQLLDDEKHDRGVTPSDGRAVPARRRGATGPRARASSSRRIEDAFYYLWRERRLPVNVDPLKSKLEDPQERARLAKVFEQGLDTVVGHVLPMRARCRRGTRWRTGPWFLRRERCYLIPGDSPMGYRLPLDSHAVGQRRATTRTSSSRIRWRRRAACRAPPTSAASSACESKIAPRVAGAAGRERASARATRWHRRPAARRAS